MDSGLSNILVIFAFRWFAKGFTLNLFHLPLIVLRQNINHFNNQVKDKYGKSISSV